MVLRDVVAKRTFVSLLSAAVLCLFLPPGTNAADKTAKGAAAYEQFPKPVRTLLKQAYATEIKRRTQIIGECKTFLSKAKSDEAKALGQQAIATAKQELEDLKQNDPPFIGMRLDAWHGDGGLDAVEMGPLTVGDIGVAALPMRIIQVTGPESAILQRRLQDSETMLVQLKGVSTEGWVDDAEVNVPGSLWVSGTVNQAGRTMVLLEPFDWERYRKTLLPK
ncbi:MAG: hypothetical protein WCH39_07380 [Schlesneria sp.]